MKKIYTAIAYFTVFVIGMITWSGLVLATDGSTEHIDSQTSAFLGDRGVGVGVHVTEARAAAANIIKGALGIIGTLFVAYAFYGGMMILTAAGDEEKVSIGKSTLRTATIGIIVVLSALGITTFVSSAILSGTGATSDEGFSIDIDPNYPLPVPPEDNTRGRLY